MLGPTSKSAIFVPQRLEVLALVVSCNLMHVCCNLLVQLDTEFQIIVTIKYSTASLAVIEALTWAMGLSRFNRC